MMPCYFIFYEIRVRTCIANTRETFSKGHGVLHQARFESILYFLYERGQLISVPRA